MTNVESDDVRLSRAMRRLMQLDPPRLAPVRPRAHHLLGAVVAGVAALVVVAGVVGGSLALHGRPPAGAPPIAASSPSASPIAASTPSASPYVSQDPIISLLQLPSWMTVCFHAGGIVVTPPADDVHPRLTPAEVIAAVRASDSRVRNTAAPAFLRFWFAPYGAPQTDESKALAQPVWAVGVDDVHFELPDPDVPANLATASPQPYSAGIIYFVSDPGATVVLELGCPSS